MHSRPAKAILVVAASAILLDLATSPRSLAIFASAACRSQPQLNSAVCRSYPRPEAILDPDYRKNYSPPRLSSRRLPAEFILSLALR